MEESPIKSYRRPTCTPIPTHTRALHMIETCVKREMPRTDLSFERVRIASRPCNSTLNPLRDHRSNTVCVSLYPASHCNSTLPPR